MLNVGSDISVGLSVSLLLLSSRLLYLCALFQHLLSPPPREYSSLFRFPGILCSPILSCLLHTYIWLHMVLERNLERRLVGSIGLHVVLLPLTLATHTPF